jgi:Flp pilus assembly protein TadG
MSRRAGNRWNWRRRDDERGIVLVWMAVVLVVLLGVAAFAVDFGFAYYTGEREQNAADAAALSGALWLPQNCNAANLPAKTRALNVAAANGYTNGAHGGQTKVTVMSHCDAGSGLGTNQLRVQVQTNVDTLFSRVFGIKTMTIKHTANAEFDPPINLGNPTSNFGSAPDCASCSQTLMWANIASQYDPKVDGNAITMGWCGSPADNCNASSGPLSNKDRDTDGEQFEIDNPSGNQLVIHLFDPAYVDAEDCTNSSLNQPLYGLNPAAPYPPGSWGTDWLTNGTGGAAWLAARTGVAPDRYKLNVPATNTVYSLYELTDPLHPLSGQFVCSFMYQGYWGPANLPQPVQWTDPSQEASAETFHNWDDFTQRAGCDPSMLTQSRYVLQVQTGSGVAKLGGGITDTTGSAGQNIFAVAACDASASGCEGGAQSVPTADPNVAVSAITKMGLSTSATNATPSFYLARVPSWAHGEILTIDFYDIGDGNLGSSPSSNATLVFSSGDGTHGPNGPPIGEFSDCSSSTLRTGTIQGRPTPWALDQQPSDSDWGKLNPSMGTGCDITLTNATHAAYFNGKWFVVDIPIPNDYTCDDNTFTSCWVKLKFNLSDPSVKLGDTTTWSAHLSGDPDRLIK